jgi:hypothetical protein
LNFSALFVSVLPAITLDTISHRKGIQKGLPQSIIFWDNGIVSDPFPVSRRAFKGQKRRQNSDRSTAIDPDVRAVSPAHCNANQKKWTESNDNDFRLGLGI